VNKIGGDLSRRIRNGNAVKELPMLRWLSELTDKDNAEVGPKIARLGTLRASGIEVPDGFAVTTTAFERFLGGNDLGRRVERELESVSDIDNLVELEEQLGLGHRGHVCGLPAVAVVEPRPR